jgi:hypothetical protein
MDKDTTRINKDGIVVDGASGGSGNPGSNGSSSLGGSDSKSGKGTAALNASGETGSNNSTGVASHGSSANVDGGDGYGGGGGGFGGSSERDPANDRYKGQGIFAGKNATTAKDPASTGPLLPMTADLFQRISNVTRTQCVRELVMCNQK